MQNEGPNALGGPDMNIEEKIQLFAELPGDERREVERYVAEHGDEQPRLRELLREAKHLEQLLESARVLSHEPPDAEALALFVVMRDVDRSRMPAALADAFDRIGEQVERDPALQEKVRAFERRGAELSEASDAEAQFATLISRESERDSSEQDDRTARPDFRTEDRPATPSRKAGPSRSNRKLRNAAAVVIVAVALYGMLFIASRYAQPAHERLADFGSGELVLEGYEEVRGEGDATMTSPTTAYVEALTYLQESQASYLGLFPHFRKAPLDSAAARLREVIAAEPEDSFLANEATYFLGKTELARGNIQAAHQALQQVATTPGVRAQEARLLLEEIQTL